MLYVVIREIEDGTRCDDALFVTSRAARQHYRKARLVCDNDPDEFGEGDPAIISRCWIYAADTREPDEARAMVRDGRAVLVASYAGETTAGRRRKTVTTRKR